jgi:hypothetical protein
MRRFSLGRFLQNIPFWVQALLVVGATSLVLFWLQFGRSTFVSTGEATVTVRQTTPAVTVTPVPTPTRVPTATPTPTLTPTPHPTPTLLPPQGGIIYALKPNVNREGWVVSGEAGNHFGESHLYTGVFEEKIYHGAFQFDISFIALGSSIHYAAVELTGLDAQRLGDGGSWSLQMLGTEVDPEWPLHGFDHIHQAPVAFTLSPILNSADLGREKTHVFVLDAGQRAELEERIARGVISFRLDGPSSGADNLFSWDTGYGDESLGNGPILRLAVAPPSVPVTPEGERIPGLGTPTPTYVILTPAPTPENVLTAAADALTATAWATMVGTPTPLPPNWVTPIIVTATPTPENEATATFQAMVSTAEVILTGTPTPTPGNVWMATPTATPTVTPWYIYLWDLPTVEPPTPTPAALPSTLVGRIAFVSNRRGGSAAYIMDTDGGQVALLTSQWTYEFASSRQEIAPNQAGHLSPDGQYIVYHVGERGDRQVWIMNVDGSEPRNISNNNYDEYDPIWLR